MGCCLFTFFHCIILFIICNINSVNSDGSPRHIVYVLSDDIGYSDISSMNGQFPTPFIDSLRSESIILNRHYIHYVCSISRTQFLTGRSPMNQGFGKENVWSYTNIGGVPIGQPTIANWLRDFPLSTETETEEIPKYKTYGIGKWHIGYSSYLQTPEYKGFDHYYGFYQGGIDYDTKTHSKADYWLDAATNRPYEDAQYDFFEDENIAFDALVDDTNTMYLYRDKIPEYLDDFISSPQENMFLYLGLQTLHAHGDFPQIPDKTARCRHILEDSNPITMRLRYCEYTLLTDDWISYLVSELKSHNLWDDTLLIFTSDNGADINKAGTGCNYPLRGSKSTYFDGNIRDVTFVAGGKNIISSNQYGAIRESLISNLDWTPTLLSYANILPYINKNDYKWDGVDVWDIIINGDNAEKERKSILLNVQGKDITNINKIPSMKIIFKYDDDDHLYKYILADIDSTKYKYDKKWATKTADGWCLVDFDNNKDIYVQLLEDSDYAKSGDIKHNQYLFDLTDDESEKYNLMRSKRINGNKLSSDELNKIINFGKNLIENELSDKYIDFYHKPLECLYKHDALGDPGLFLQETPIRGLYIEPFLDRNEYLSKITDCFNDINEDENEYPIPDKLKDLYLNDWIPPKPINNNYYVYNDKSQILIKNNHSYIIELIIGVVIFIIIGIFYLYKSRNKEYLPL